eukprot:g4005.t1
MDDFQQSFADEESHDGFLGGGVRQDSSPYQPESSTLEDSSVPPRDSISANAVKDELGGASIEVDSIGVTDRATGSAVYIANLQWWTTDADVERLCSAYGPVVNIHFLAERSNGKSKGVALVEFTDSQAALRCKEGLSGFSIHGKNCVVTFPNQSFQRGYGTRGGYGGYERGRMSEGRSRGRYGRGYNHGMHEMRPGMQLMGDMPGYMHDMGMVDVCSEMVSGMAPIDGQMMSSHGPGYNLPPPYPVGGATGYMGDEMYEQNPYFRRGDRFEKGIEGDEVAPKRQRPS